MKVETVVFVSKRLATIAAAVLCLMSARLLNAAHASAASPTETRVAITR